MNIKDFITKNIINHPRDIVGFAMSHYHISRPAVLKHLNALIRDGIVSVTGRTKARNYSLSSQKTTSFTLPITPKLEEGDVWQTRIHSLTQTLPKHIQDICHYGFTEMLNNVIDHSEGNEVVIGCSFSANLIRITLLDNGIGIFKKIQNALRLDTTRETVLHLTKGKFTTDPTRHSGEGIFFTSRVFDSFTLSSNGIRYMRHHDADWAVDSTDANVGTFVDMELSASATTTLESVFKNYTDPETLSFNKTQVLVELAKLEGESFISRSQAKRVLVGLDKFKTITFDFKNVRTVGQGFVDEVFRVFQNSHPDIQLTPTNMNEDVEFMIKRGLPAG